MLTVPGPDKRSLIVRYLNCKSTENFEGFGLDHESGPALASLKHFVLLHYFVGHQVTFASNKVDS